MKASVFPGQGSQAKGMGRDLFDRFPAFCKKADDILGYDIRKLCLEDPDGLLGRTERTQPALYVVNALGWLARAEDENDPPDFLAGHSLGEYNALFASGAFDFETGLSLVKERGRLMAGARGGGMAAVLGMGPDAVQDVLSRHSLDEIAIANHNSPAQLVISGKKEEIQRAIPIFKKARAKCVLLKVSGAFHSPHMAPAALEFASFLKAFQFADPAIPVISNVSARPYEKNAVPKALIDQMTSPVRWTDSIRRLMDQGVCVFEEIGPGKVLTGLIRRIQKG